MKAGRLKNRAFQIACLAAALVVPLVVAGMLATLVAESMPAVERFGVLKFLFSASWDYSADVYGARRPLSGTLLTTFLAMAAALPVALGTAVFLTELCPERLRGPIGTALELLSAIPSIIYGMWGLLVMAPFLEATVQPLAAATLGGLPMIGGFFQTRLAGGVNIFTASMILAVMILPLITSIAREAFSQVSPMLKESSYGLGATRWETVRQVVMPASKMAVVGGATIAMGRALGETMAVAYVIGNRHAALDSIFSPYATITSVMANEFNEAAGLKLSVLFYLALALFVANLAVLMISRRLLGSARWTI
jgi:phosphate transport system permease protein